MTQTKLVGRDSAHACAHPALVLSTASSEAVERMREGGVDLGGYGLRNAFRYVREALEAASAGLEEATIYGQLRRGLNEVDVTIRPPNNFILKSDVLVVREEALSAAVAVLESEPHSLGEVCFVPSYGVGRTHVMRFQLG